MSMIIEVNETTRLVGRVCPAQWCAEEDTRDNVRARRNVMAGLWAGHLLGFGGEKLEAYAAEVHFSDFQVVGDSDIISKILADLVHAGLTIDAGAVRSQLHVFHREALVQTHVTD